MVGLATLTRSIGVRIPGGQPIHIKTERPGTSLNVLDARMFLPYSDLRKKSARVRWKKNRVTLMPFPGLLFPFDARCQYLFVQDMVGAICECVSNPVDTTHQLCLCSIDLPKYFLKTQSIPDLVERNDCT
jgi:hypothetical protein